MVTKGFGGLSAKHTNPCRLPLLGGRKTSKHMDILPAKILACFCHSGLQSGENLYHQSHTSCNCHSDLCKTHEISLQRYPRDQTLGCASCPLFWNADSALEIHVLSLMQAGGKWEFFAISTFLHRGLLKRPKQFSLVQRIPWKGAPPCSDRGVALFPSSVGAFHSITHQKGNMCKPEWGRMGPWLRASSWWGTQVHQDPGNAWSHWLTLQLCWQGDKNLPGADLPAWRRWLRQHNMEILRKMGGLMCHIPLQKDSQAVVIYIALCFGGDILMDEAWKWDWLLLL